MKTSNSGAGSALFSMHLHRGYRRVFFGVFIFSFGFGFGRGLGLGSGRAVEAAASIAAAAATPAHTATHAHTHTPTEVQNPNVEAYTHTLPREHLHHQHPSLNLTHSDAVCVWRPAGSCSLTTCATLSPTSLLASSTRLSALCFPRSSTARRKRVVSVLMC